MNLTCVDCDFHSAKVTFASRVMIVALGYPKLILAKKENKVCLAWPHHQPLDTNTISF